MITSFTHALSALRRTLNPQVLAVGLGLIAVSSSYGHSVWLDATPDKTVVLKFGEYPEKVEVSPGMLDRIPDPVAWNTTDTTPVIFTVKRDKEFLALEKSSSDVSVIAKVESPVREPRGDKPAPPSRTIYHVRWHGATAGEARLDFDLVPSKGDKFQAIFRGQPVAEAKIKVLEPDGERKEITADKEGFFSYAPTKEGLHLLSSRQQEKEKGQFQGKAFEGINHSVILSLPVAKK